MVYGQEEGQILGHTNESQDIIKWDTRWYFSATKSKSMQIMFSKN